MILLASLVVSLGTLAGCGGDEGWQGPIINALKVRAPLSFAGQDPVVRVTVFKGSQESGPEMVWNESEKVYEAFVNIVANEPVWFAIELDGFEGSEVPQFLSPVAAGVTVRGERLCKEVELYVPALPDGGSVLVTAAEFVHVDINSTPYVIVDRISSSC